MGLQAQNKPEHLRRKTYRSRPETTLQSGQSTTSAKTSQTVSIKAGKATTATTPLAELRQPRAAPRQRTAHPRNDGKVTSGKVTSKTPCLEDAIRASEQVLSSPTSETSICLHSVRLARLSLQKILTTGQVEGGTITVLQHGVDKLGGPLKGTSADFDDLLVEVSGLRRTATQSYMMAAGSVASVMTDKSLRTICRSVVTLCLRFLNRYLGNSPANDAPAKSIERYTQRKSLVEKIATAAVDSVFATIKTAIVADEVTFDELHPALSDCLDLISKVDVGGTPASSTASELKCKEMWSAKASNVYWAYFLRQRKSSVSITAGCPLHRCLRRSVELAKSLSREGRTVALLAIKTERLGAVLESQARHEDAAEQYRESVRLHLEDGVLLEASKVAETLPVRSVWETPGRVTILGRTVTSLLRSSSKGLVETPDAICLFDNDSLDASLRGIILEWQLEILSDMLVTTRSPNKYRGTINALSSSLLQTYTIDQSPIRRLRSLGRVLRLYTHDCSLALGNTLECLVAEAHTVLASSAIGQDLGLEQYKTHLKAALTVTLALREQNKSTDALVESLISWTRLVESSDQRGGALEDHIDNLETCLTLISSVSDYFEMKGHQKLRIPTLRLLVAIRKRQSPCDEELLSLDLSKLGVLYSRLGFSGKAGLTLAEAQCRLEDATVVGSAALYWHLCYAEYLLVIGNVERSSETLAQARALAEAKPDFQRATQANATASHRIQNDVLVADASYVCSRLAFEKGNLHASLMHAKRCVKLFHRIWAALEGRQGGKARTAGADSSSDSDIDAPIEGMSRLALSASKTSPSSVISMTHASLNGAAFWRLVAPLFRGLDNLASLFSHLGMFRESIYYAQQAQRVVEAVGAEPSLLYNMVMMGQIQLRAGRIVEASSIITKALENQSLAGAGRVAVSLNCSYAELHRIKGDYGAEMTAYDNADKVLRGIMSEDEIDGIDIFPDPMIGINSQLAHLALANDGISSRKQAAARTEKPTASKDSSTRKVTSAVKAKSPQAPSAAYECMELLGLRAGVLRLKAVAMVSQRHFAAAAALLDEANRACHRQQDVIQQRISSAKHLLQSSLDLMSADAVFCVLQESTISSPSIAVAGSSRLSRSSPSKVVINRLVTTRARRRPDNIESTAVSRRTAKAEAREENFVDLLHRGRDSISEVFALVMGHGSTTTVRVISSLLSGIIMLLSAASPSRGPSLSLSFQAVHSIESAKTEALLRERCATSINNSPTSHEALTQWPSVASKTSSCDSLDYGSFQRAYIDIIPSCWTTISIHLSEDHSELYITKLLPNTPPFILRLPLDRHNSRDADEEVFNYSQCSDELREIIDLANFSAHDARDMSQKGARTQWWAERDALDNRLRDLLFNVENVWLGGFRGIFARTSPGQHTPGFQRDLLARFQRSFHNILDRYLPSRQPSVVARSRASRRTKASSAGTKPSKTSIPPDNRVNLDPRILELFISLSSPELATGDEAIDLEEPLTDLLYFIIDILQFNGERNAYDEIEFDSLVVETQDALAAYHAELAKAVFSSSTNDPSVGHPTQHTILILDKALHGIPWESLPCLRGQAVSRLPSLGCLRSRILAMHEQRHQPCRAQAPAVGLHVDQTNGSFILNPSGDLTSTQKLFAPALAPLHESWTHTTNSPNEAYLADLLEQKDIYLYLAHGSGSQYIRTSKLRSLRRLPSVVMLFGCSSVKLEDGGDYEGYGPLMGYLQGSGEGIEEEIRSGAGAVVGGLWDTTDRDLDRVSMEALKQWGLIPSSESGTHPVGKVSLSEAMAQGREMAKLRYLNGAAVVVYGVPAYLK